MLKSSKINSLAFRQAKTVFFVSVLLGVCFGLYHIVVDLHQEKNRIEEHYQFKLMQNYSSASLAAYHLSPLLADQVATSLMIDQGIYKVEIIDNFGEVLAQNSRQVSPSSPLVTLLSDFLIPEKPIFEIELHQPNSHINVGQLVFSINGNSIAKDFLAKTNTILLFDLFRNAILTSILLLFFYHKMSKPIVTLSNWVNALHNGKNETPPPALHRRDELGTLAVSFHNLFKDKEIAKQKLNKLAYYDPLTGLANRSLLLQLLSGAVQKAEQTDQNGALFYLDLDRFKTINDSLGHTIGDKLIQAVSLRLKSWLDDRYTAARIGGDEFVILLPDTSKEQALEQAQQLMSVISNPYSIDGHQLYCTASAGITTFPSSGSRDIEFLRQADTALYKAKAKGNNKFVLYHPKMQAQIESFLEVERGLHEALKKNQLELYYQPQVNRDHQIVGVEALIRWNHPEKGVLPPGLFMPIAEETGQILQIGNWIIERACFQFSEWQKQGVLPDTLQRIAINISPLQFSQDSFVDHINEALEQAGISGKNIELEITESLLLDNMDSAIKKMELLKEKHIKISIDDFGTGYSSLKYLKHLAVDVLKIDRSFVTQLHLDTTDQAIVDAIIMTAKRLNLDVIAEGVEDVNELTVLKAMGCYQFQGYLFDKPLPEQELRKRFAENYYHIEETHLITSINI
ncbi:putative bifunctional diguanylate cyclase/phosphodiesterase [Vibrio japonicus]|uniref:EAL domain-containing protein n=1 Tax=Vibrio japonicus TaxID=1824638 RepID=A0ABY5LEA3_9VIBR|nr:EAL domain-containing protein [Vibrio japonicus]UUM30151.1 EAL domain-containing protein [Vibrio japonicus]